MAIISSAATPNQRVVLQTKSVNLFSGTGSPISDPFFPHERSTNS